MLIQLRQRYLNSTNDTIINIESSSSHFVPAIIRMYRVETPDITYKAELNNAEVKQLISFLESQVKRDEDNSRWEIN